MDYCTPVEQDAWPVSYKHEFEYSFSGETDMADTQVAIYDYERADEHIITVVFRGSEVPDIFNTDKLGPMAYIKKLKYQLPSFFKGKLPYCVHVPPKTLLVLPFLLTAVRARAVTYTP